MALARRSLAAFAALALALCAAPNYGDNEFPLAPLTERSECQRERCTAWECTGTDLPGDNDHLTCSEWNCTERRSSVCSRWECTAADVPGADDQTCAGFVCAAWSDGSCARWSCASSDLHSLGVSVNDRDTCAEYRCALLERGACADWRCTLAPLPPPANSRQSCSRYDCSRREREACLGWRCLNSTGYASCARFGCASRSDAGCDGWACDATEAAGRSSYATCAAWSCSGWERSPLRTGCRGCASQEHCASGCCALGECIEPAADPDADRSSCLCAGRTWKGGRCCGDDPGEGWCAEGGACVRGTWVAGTGSEFHCVDCQNGTWNEDRCCVEGESWCGQWGRCMYGSWRPLCKPCYACRGGVCEYVCRAEDQDGDRSPDDCTALGGIWRDDRCCGDDAGESWFGAFGECRSGFWFELTAEAIEERIGQEEERPPIEIEDVAEPLGGPPILAALVVLGLASFAVYHRKRRGAIAAEADAFADMEGLVEGAGSGGAGAREGGGAEPPEPSEGEAAPPGADAEPEGAPEEGGEGAAGTLAPGERGPGGADAAALRAKLERLDSMLASGKLSAALHARMSAKARAELEALGAGGAGETEAAPDGLSLGEEGGAAGEAAAASGRGEAEGEAPAPQEGGSARPGAARGAAGGAAVRRERTKDGKEDIFSELGMASAPAERGGGGKGASGDAGGGRGVPEPAAEAAAPVAAGAGGRRGAAAGGRRELRSEDDIFSELGLEGPARRPARPAEDEGAEGVDAAPPGTGGGGERKVAERAEEGPGVSGAEAGAGASGGGGRREAAAVAAKLERLDAMLAAGKLSPTVHAKLRAKAQAELDALAR